MNTASLRGLALILLAAGAFAPAAASAAQASEKRSAIVQKLVDCRKLTDDAARLACYDQAAAAFDQAEAKGDVLVIDRDQAREVRKQAFGFTLPSISLFEKGGTKEEVDQTDGVIASARQDPGGHWVIKLEDGAVWVEVSAGELFRTPKPGMKVRIKKASLGSFLMVIENQGGFKAHRVQ